MILWIYLALTITAIAIFLFGKFLRIKGYIITDSYFRFFAIILLVLTATVTLVTGTTYVSGQNETLRVNTTANLTRVEVQQTYSETGILFDVVFGLFNIFLGLLMAFFPDAKRNQDAVDEAYNSKFND
jgi:hypothetical protein